MEMIYIIGNHKQSIVYNDQWFDYKSFCYNADYGTLPTMEKLFGKTGGIVLSTHWLTYNSKPYSFF